MRVILAVAVFLGGLTSAGIWTGIQVVDNVQQQDSIQIQAGRTNVHSGGHREPRHGGGNHIKGGYAPKGGKY